MSAGGTAIREVLLRFNARRRGYSLAGRYAGNEPPLRSELFSTDQMHQHGQHLAASHELLAGSTPDRLLRRLAENEDILLRTRGLMAAAAAVKRRIAPAGEWLLDNFYLIEEHIRTAKRHLPHEYSRGLPRLARGPSAGLPRVYDIALEAISHSDGHVDPERLGSFLAAYQTVAALTLGELWAIPIMLRLALIENLRRAGSRLAADKIDRNRADYWADRMVETAQREPKNLILVVADMARSRPPMVGSFVAELARRLQGQSPALALPLTWIEQRLSESGLTIRQLVQMENQQQAIDQVSVSNSIGSLRLLSAMDWREFVETMSVVEQTLRRDPAGVYGRMEFATRDSYRHVVETLATRSAATEGEIAGAAIRLAQQSAVAEDTDERRHHVGFYLIGSGLPQLEAAVQTRDSAEASLRRVGSRHPLQLYLGTIAALTALFTAGLMMYVVHGTASAALLVLAAVASLLATSQLAVALANWFATLLTRPRPLPRLDFTAGIPRQYRTLVVVPALIDSQQDVDQLAGALEVRFLANRDENLRFALLTDFTDASRETLPEDAPLLRLAAQRITALNEKYSGEKNDIFFLFHRPRRWNPQQGAWIGQERKRGKLADLNALLRATVRGDAGGRFLLVVGEIARLVNVKYVITLDADTQLPRDAARQFVAAMAHPLNRPRFGATTGHRERVVAGYGILQPRVAVSLPATNRSWYARLYGDDPGIDPYTRAVSDVYQDVFGEGSFIGKGIYDVDAFERALGGRFPENRILSHDLLEGCYARAGLLSDAQLYEEYPCRYGADVKRRQRWIRGDWQLAAWLLPRVPGPGGRRVKNPLSGLSRWKIFDNLRRSLVPVALMVLLMLGWIALAPIRWWTLAVVGIMLALPVATSLVEL
ncbi:MAG TPA: glycosyltransferase family 2 protein, partial [Burkholderiales bacterium]|nr:glycosyltransferase family 2 protein [Burkholderiales bacterium]